MPLSRFCAVNHVSGLFFRRQESETTQTAQKERPARDFGLFPSGKTDWHQGRVEEQRKTKTKKHFEHPYRRVILTLYDSCLTRRDYRVEDDSYSIGEGGFLFFSFFPLLSPHLNSDSNHRNQEC